MGLNLLFLGGGRRVKLLNLFKETMGKYDKLYTTDTESMPSTQFIADKVFKVPPCKDTENFIPCVAEICKNYNISAVIPLITAAVKSIILLRRETDTFIVSGSDESVRICTDKRLTQKYFSEKGVNYPKTIINPQICDIPIVARPRFGEGSRGVYFMSNDKEFNAYSLIVSEKKYIYTHFIKGDEYTIDCYKDFDGKIISIVPRQRLRIRAGEVEKAVTRNIPRIENETRVLINGLNFIGPTTLQCILSHGIPYFTEINLRYGGGVTLSFEAGARSYSWLINELRDGVKPRFSTYKKDLHFVRYDEEFFF